MRCSLTPKEQNAFIQYLAKHLEDLAASKEDVNLQDIIKHVYEVISQNGKFEEQALDYAYITPSLLGPILTNNLFTQTPLLRKKGLRVDDILDLKEVLDDPKTGIDYLKEYIGLSTSPYSEMNSDLAIAEQDMQSGEMLAENFWGDEVEPVIENIDGVYIEKEEPKEEAPKEPVVTAPNLVESFSARPASVLKDTEREAPKDKNSENYNIPYKEKHFYYQVKRALVRALRAAKDFDSIQLGSHESMWNTPLYLRIVPESLIPENERRETPDDIKVGGGDRLVMILVDKEGYPVRLLVDETQPEGQQFVRDPESGKLPYFYLRTLHKEKNFKGDEIVLMKDDTFDDYETVSALMRANPNLTKEEATEIVLDELKALYDIEQRVRKGENVTAYITGGTLGYVEKAEPRQGEKLKNILKADERPRIEFAEMDMGDLKNGQTFVKLEDMHGIPLPLERPLAGETLSKNGETYAEKLAWILTGDYEVELEDGKRKKVDEPLRQKYYFNYANNSHVQTYFEEGDLHVKIWNADSAVIYKLKNANRKELRNAITKALSEERFERTISPDSMTEIQKKSLTSVKSIKSVKSTDFKVNSVVFDESTKKYWLVDKVKLNYTKDRKLQVWDHFSDLFDGEFNENHSVYKQTDVTRAGWVKEHFTSVYKTNAENRPQVLNSYLTFKVMDKALEDNFNRKEEVEEPIVVSETQLEEKKEEPLTYVKREKRKFSKRPSRDVTKYDIDDIIAANLDKNLFQAYRNGKVSKEQIEAAFNWWQKSPLSSKIPFTAMFNAVNSAKPNTVATWTTWGITLYKGSDYVDLYHEAWHGFTQTFMTKEQREELYKDVRKLSGHFLAYDGHTVTFNSATEKQLEEWLAEDFRNFMLTGKIKNETPVRKSWYTKILDILKVLFEGLSFQEVVNDGYAIGKLNDIYTKLKVGDLSNYNYSLDNVEHKSLDFGTIEAHKDYQGKSKLSHQESEIVVKTFDSLIAEFVDIKNKGLNSKETEDYAALLKKVKREKLSNQEKARLEKYRGNLTFKYTSKLFKSTTGKQEVYKYIYSRLSQIYDQFNEEFNTAIEEYEALEEHSQVLLDKIEATESKLKLLEFVLDNFGDTSNLENNKQTGVIKYHVQKSQIISLEDKQEFFESTEADDFLKSERIGDRSGNEYSLKELGFEEIIQLLKTVRRTKLDGTFYTNDLNVPEIIDFDIVWNRLVKLLQGSINPEKMYKKLVEKQKDYPEITDLLSKLGPLETQDISSNDLWTKFWQTFNKTHVPLLQTTIRKTTVKTDETGSVQLSTPEYNITVGQAFGESQKVTVEWRTLFKQALPSKYITKVDNQNRLNIPNVLKEFVSANNINENGRELEFLHAIGIMLDDIEEIRNDLRKYPTLIKHIFENLVYINKRPGAEVTEPGDIFRGYPAMKLGGNNISGRTNSNNNYNILKSLQARHSDRFSNYMASNAEGNTQFEHTLNSSMTIIVNTINDVNTYDELISIPYMSFLDYRRNPSVLNSIWLNKIFVLKDDKGGLLDRTSTLPDGKKFGDKRDVIKNKKSIRQSLDFNNLSGVSFESDGVYNPDLGIASASADKYSKLLMDFHNVLGRGLFEMMRHADKSTSYSLTLAKVSSNESNLYIDTHYFEQTPDLNVGKEAFINILMGYLDSEVKRIYELRNNDSYNTNFDFNYKKRGSNFVAFEGILGNDVRKQLLDANISNIKTYLDSPENSKLKDAIRHDIGNYLEQQTNRNIKLFGKRYFMSDVLKKDIISAGQGRSFQDLKTRDEKLKRAAIMSYTANTFIHNMESSIVIYGDVALYNHSKEEFHKRNAGAGSTGSIYRTDVLAQNFIRSIGRPYTSSTLSNKPSYPVRDYDGTLNTAVVADKEYQSLYLETYAKQMIDELLAEGVSQEEAEKKIYGYDVESGKIGSLKKLYKNGIAFPYSKMTEADAQAWVSFDAYRHLLILEGTWDWNNQEVMFQKIVRGERINNKDLHKYFPVQKLQYWGQLKTDKLPLVGFHKYSLMPLIPSVIKDTALETLHNRMMNEEIDYVVVQSGSKVSTINYKEGEPDKIYKDNSNASRELNDEKHDNNQFFTKNVIHVEFLKNQLKIHDHYKNKVVFPTQLRKLIESGLISNGVANDFMKDKPLEERRQAWKKLTEEEKINSSVFYSKVVKYEKDIEKLTTLKKEALLKEIGWDKNKGYSKSNVRQLIEFVRGQLEVQDVADHELDFLQVDSKGHIVNDLSISLSSDKIEKMLNSIVVNRLVRQKVFGEQYILAASTGTEKFTKPSIEDLDKYGSNDLPFYSKKDGKTRAMKVKIAMTFGETVNGIYKKSEFEKLLDLEHNDGYSIYSLSRLNEMLQSEEWLDKNDHRRMVTLIGTRIPTQGLNSMEFMEVYEFLPAEAGAILIPPPEIVAKAGSDFDIDKLNVIKPKYDYDEEGKLIIAHQKTKESVRKIYDKFIHSRGVLGKYIKKGGVSLLRVDYEVDKLVSDIFGEHWKDNWTIEEIDELAKDKNLKSFEDFYAKFQSEKAITNDIIWDIADILSLPENFTKLITPNSTSLVQPVAEELEDYVRDFKFKSGKTGIQGTRVFEVAYNLYKHNSNNVGKQTLGLGAVDNTYNVLFNRVGAFMNYTAGMSEEEYNYILNSKKQLSKEDKKKLRDFRYQVLNLPHNTVKDNKGKDVISLSHERTLENEDISEIISQLINGWVDVAKDAWIFDIQGNKETAASLLFMVQAGVPFKTAVYMVSLPIVRDYMENQRLIKSTFADPLGVGKDVINVNMEAKNEAIKMILNSPVYGFEDAPISETKDGKEVVYPSELYTYGRNLISKTLKGSNFEQSLLKSYIVNHNNDKPMYDDYQRAAFMHFLEIEKMASHVRDIKLKVNVDTTRSGSVFEAENRIIEIEKLREDAAIDTNIVDKILKTGEYKDSSEAMSPISSFYIQSLQGEIWKDLFELKSHPAFVNYMRDKFRSGVANDIKITYGNADTFNTMLRNDFINYIFQNEFDDFSLSQLKYYKGIELNDKIPVSNTKGLTIGAFYHSGQLHIDVETLSKQYNAKTYLNEGNKDYIKLGLAKVDPRNFPTFNSYVRFVLEREYLRATNPKEVLNNLTDYNLYKKLKAGLYKQLPGESPEDFESRVETSLYESYLRDRALNNIGSVHKLFRGQDTYAHQFFRIYNSFPELKKRFPVMEFLTITEKGGITNLRPLDPFFTSEQVNIFHENLQELANQNVVKVDNPQDNLFISQFFGMMYKVAILQSGFNTKSTYSLLRLVPEETYLTIMKEASKKHVNLLNKFKNKPEALKPYFDNFYRLFIQQNAMGRSNERIRFKDYLSPIKPLDLVNRHQRITNLSVVKSVGDILLYSPYHESFKTKQTINGVEVEQTDSEKLAAFQEANPNYIFVYNSAQDVNNPKSGYGDYMFATTNQSNKHPLITMKKFTGHTQSPEESLFLDKEGEADPEFVQIVEDIISQLIDYKSRGYKLVFNELGYGGYMVGIDRNTGQLKAGGSQLAPENFLYLSKRLKEEFGYTNPGYKVEVTEPTRVSKLTNEEVEELIKKCRGK